jgi:HAD superfamily hydrolase (TIGR01549 family)
VLFDLDNTLIDSASLVRSSLAGCGCQGVDAIPADDFRCLSPYELLQRLERADARDAYWRLYKRLVSERVRLLDEQTPSVLAQLRGRGVRLGLVTSSVKEVVASALEKCGIAGFFADCMVTYGTCRRRKPHPEPIQHALRLLRHGVEGAMYVGDAERDAITCRNAGVHFGLAAWSAGDRPTLASLAPTRVLRRMSDVLEYA